MAAIFVGFMQKTKAGRQKSRITEIHSMINVSISELSSENCSSGY